MSSSVPTRPTALSPEVVADYASLLLPYIKTWGGEMITAMPNLGQDLVDAITAAEDAYARVQFLERDRGWIVNGELVAVFLKSTALHTAALHAAYQVWVIETGTRFPAKEMREISFMMLPKRGGILTKGTVRAVIPSQARAVVEYIVHIGGVPHIKTADVFAEDVTHIHDKKKALGVSAIRQTVGFTLPEPAPIPVSLAGE